MKKSSVIVLVLTLFCGTALAAGGLESGTAAVSTFRDWMFNFLGVVAFIYLMYKGIEAWAEKIQWIDFLTAIGKVAAVGGVLTLTTWAWGLFAS